MPLARLDGSNNKQGYIKELIRNDIRGDGDILSVDAISLILRPFIKRYDLKKVTLFGSYARGSATTESDIDLLIDSNGIESMKDYTSLVRYILESYDTTKHYLEEEYRGCSAEGHISHILSDRLSSRPRVWSETGIDEMARLRVTVKNGGEIFPLMLAKKQERKRYQEQIEIDRKIIQKRKLAAGAELQHNIPIINRGQVGESLKMMRGFRNL